MDFSDPQKMVAGFQISVVVTVNHVSKNGCWFSNFCSSYSKSGEQKLITKEHTRTNIRACAHTYTHTHTNFLEKSNCQKPGMHLV